MGKIFFALVIAGLCSGQTLESWINHSFSLYRSPGLYAKPSSQWDNSMATAHQLEEDSVSETQKGILARNLSIELLGGMHFTFRHKIRAKEWAELPLHMWSVGCEIGYRFRPHAVISWRGGYSYTKDLGGYTIPRDGTVIEMKFSNSNLTCLMSYKSAYYLIGCGLDVSYMTLLRKGWNMFYPDTVNISEWKAIWLRPVLSGSAEGVWIHPLYLKLLFESRLLPITRFDADGIGLPKVQPSLYLGLVYRFNF